MPVRALELLELGGLGELLLLGERVLQEQAAFFGSEFGGLLHVLVV